ncbi:MAG: hypothetical protein ACLPVF_03270 [Acidimicrobiales bacterium]
MEQPVAEQALLALEPLVGEWAVEAKGPDGQVWQRFAGRISEDGRTITGCWEKAEDGEHFTVDFYLTYRKTPHRP